MVAWIISADGEHIEVTRNSHHYGPVLKLTVHHAVQKTGRGQYAVHVLDDLDIVPALNDKGMIIKYKVGLGTVIGSSGAAEDGHGHERNIFSHERKEALAR
ncbi:MAG: hypothetical protein Q7K57_40180 [Burkholderiaceae bacterium]|nr:hypothetical protein [Burkholderiaceae bacterium]